MSDDILRDLQARFQPGMGQEQLFAVVLDDALADAGPAAAEAFLAAAVPHWFSAGLLAALLARPAPEAAGLLARIGRYSSFMSQRPDGACLYQEKVRVHLLARVKADPNRFRGLSRRAAGFFESRGAARADARSAELAEWLYHGLAVDDAQAFARLTRAYHALEFRYDLAACGRLLALAQEQADRLTADRPLWLRYYQGRLLERSQRWGEALETWEPLLHEALAPELQSWLAIGLGNVYRAQRRWEEALAQYAVSLGVFRALGDRQGEATTLNNIGEVYQAQGRWAEALAQYAASLEIFRALGDRQGEAQMQNNLGLVHEAQGWWEEALAQYAASLEIFRALGDRQGEASTLGNLGLVYEAQGRWGEARAQYAASLDITQALEGTQIKPESPVPAVSVEVGRGAVMQGVTIGNIANVIVKGDAPAQPRPAPEPGAAPGWTTELIRKLLTVAFSDEELTALCFDHFWPVYHGFSAGMSTGQKVQCLLEYCVRYERLAELLRLAQQHNPMQFARFQARGRWGETLALNNLGALYSRRGDWEQAHLLLQQALEIGRQLGARELEACALHDLGECHKRQGQWDEAIAHYREALALRHELGAQAQVGETLDALGEVYRMRGMWAEAVQTHEEGLAIWRELARPGGRAASPPSAPPAA